MAPGVDDPQTLLRLSSVDPVVLSVLLSPYARIFAFVWGLLWGSFANVVIYRVPRGMSVVTPRSRCGVCETPVAWYDNIPVLSYLVLGGRCRHCKTRFGMRYLMVELIGGAMSLVAYAQCVIRPGLAGTSLDWWSLGVWLLWFLFAMALIIVTYVDLDLWIIPPQVTVPVTVLGLVAAWSPWPAWTVDPVLASVATAAGALIVLAIRWIYLRFRGMEGMGLGDAYLLAMIGAFQGIGGLGFAICAGAIQGLLVAVPLRLMGKSVANHDIHEIHGEDPTLGPAQSEADLMGTMVPFGPFLALAALEYFAFGRVLKPWLAQLGWAV